MLQLLRSLGPPLPFLSLCVLARLRALQVAGDDLRQDLRIVGDARDVHVGSGISIRSIRLATETEKCSETGELIPDGIRKRTGAIFGPAMDAASVVLFCEHPAATMSAVVHLLFIVAVSLASHLARESVYFVATFGSAMVVVPVFAKHSTSPVVPFFSHVRVALVTQLTYFAVALAPALRHACSATFPRVPAPERSRQRAPCPGRCP